MLSTEGSRLVVTIAQWQKKSKEGKWCNDTVGSLSVCKYWALWPACNLKCPQWLETLKKIRREREAGSYERRLQHKWAIHSYWHCASVSGATGGGAECGKGWACCSQPLLSVPHEKVDSATKTSKTCNVPTFKMLSTNLGWGGVVGRKWRQLYLNNNKKMWKKFFKIYDLLTWLNWFVKWDLEI